MLSLRACCTPLVDAMQLEKKTWLRLYTRVVPAMEPSFNGEDRLLASDPYELLTYQMRYVRHLSLSRKKCGELCLWLPTKASSSK